jgi:hypothetical protein
MNDITIKPYDPIDEAIYLFQKFNDTPVLAREYGEDELTQLVVHRIRQELD